MHAAGRAGSARGQSLVEFAISGLVLAILLAGVADLGRAFYYSVALQGAAREGARQAGYAASYGAQPALDGTAVVTTVNRELQGSGLTATLRPADCPSTTTGNAPFPSDRFPTTPGTVYLYVCYQAPGQSGYGALNQGQTYTNGDVDVILLMSYGLISGWFQSLAPGGLHIAANVHMPVQG